jgi:transposase InsO family protein
MSNPRPRLSVFARHLACLRVTRDGWSVVRVASALGVSRQTIHKWLRRFRVEGPAGLVDHSSRPHRMPRLTRIDLAVRVCLERVRTGFGPHLLSYLVGMARSTVYAVLRRAELNRALPGRVDRPLRYEWPSCGDLVHLDTKRLAKIRLDDGWRNRGRAGMTHTHRPRTGYEFCHVAVDDHSRWAETELLPDELAGSAVAALERVHARFLAAGVRLRRVLTDNGNCYRSLDFAAACRRLGIVHWRTRPYTPRTNGKAERFIKTLQKDWAYARLYRSTAERAAALPSFLADYRSRPNVGLGGHTPMCRFSGVNDVSGNHN